MSARISGTVDGIRLGTCSVTKSRSALTVMAWVNADIWTAGTNAKIVGYSTGTSAVNSRLTMVSQGAAPGQIQLGARALDTDPQRTLNYPVTLATGDWLHIAGSVNYATNILQIYINGSAVIAGLVAAFGATQTDNTDTLSVGFGVREGTGVGSQGLTGMIEDIRLYDGILDNDTIGTIYAARGKDGIYNGLLHRYPFLDAAPGVAIASVACVAGEEFLVGTPVGSPKFDVGTTVARRRDRHPVGAYGG